MAVLVHPETHFTDEKAGQLRSAAYRRLRRHWQFLNELVLFEIDHHVSYGIHVYGAKRIESDFIQATSLYHPDTVVWSLKHDGSGVEPGLKDDDGRWDLRPHASRIQRVDTATLGTWHAVLESDEVPVEQSRMVYTVNKSTAAVLDKLAAAPRIGELGLSFSAGWHEKNDRTKGFFDAEWGVPESWDSVILQGPHLHVANPFYKQPNPTMLHNQDWTPIDLEALPPDAIPATSYKPRGDRARYDAAYTHWAAGPEGSVAARSRYRVAWRRMAANTGERTLISTVLPPGVAHVDGIVSAAPVRDDPQFLVDLSAQLSALTSDFVVRSTPKADIRATTIERIPVISDEHPLLPDLRLRYLRLTCLTDSFADMWESSFDSAFSADCWATGVARTTVGVAEISPNWNADTPLRRAVDRRQASLEIDAIVAVALGVTADELAAIYRTQFPVLAGYDRSTYVYDENGRVVPNSIVQAERQGRRLDLADRTVVHRGSGVAYQYDPPFTVLDREADLTAAHADFSERLASRSSNTA